MALCIAGLSASGETVIEGAECAEVSYPSFFVDICNLGADINTKNNAHPSFKEKKKDEDKKI
jgi:UDP-N-acetylglucosamine enolpyruvyl transferase